MNKKVSSEVKKDSSKTTNSNQNSQNLTTNDQTQKPESVETKEPTPANDKSVDTSSIDYSIHRGRIDCYSSEECMNKSIPIQFKFNNSIINSYYVEVKANDNSTLGYFIEYVFSESNYSSPDECNKVGNEMKQTLPEKINGYQCIDSTLKINTSY